MIRAIIVLVVLNIILFMVLTIKQDRSNRFEKLSSLNCMKIDTLADTTIWECGE